MNTYQTTIKQKLYLVQEKISEMLMQIYKVGAIGIKYNTKL